MSHILNLMSILMKQFDNVTMKNKSKKSYVSYLKSYVYFNEAIR